MLSRKSRWILASAALFSLTGLTTRAATFTWSGNGGNVNWSTGNNWAGTAPTSLAANDLVFAGSINTGTSGTPLNQNIGAGFLFNSLNFSSGGSAFFIGGSSFGLTNTTNTITQSSASAESIANAFAHAGANSSRVLSLTGIGAGVVTLSGNITEGTGQRTIGITKSGSTSTFVLSGTNSYSDPTNVNAGTLIGTNSGAFGSSAITLGGGTLGLRNNTATNFARNVTVSASSGIFSDLAASGAGVNHTLGQLSMGANTLSVGAGSNVTSGTAGITFGVVNLSGAPVFDVADNTNLTLGALTNNFTFTKQGNGTLTLNASSARTLGAAINGGTVVLGNAGGLGNGSVTINNATLNLATVSPSTSSLILSSGNVTATTGTLSLGGNIVSSGTSLISAPVALTGNRNLDVTNTLTVSNRISGANFGINKLGAGELILSGPNTYAGLTDIQNGQVTLKNTGTIAGSIRVASGKTFDVTDFGATGFSVANGSTLSGSGTVSGKVNIGGTAKISPGDAGSAPAALATGDEQWAGGGTYTWEIKDANGAAGVDYDQLQLAGTLNVTATSGSQFNIDITSLTAANANGNAANFVKTENYDWVIATSSNPVAIDPTVFNLVDHFTNDTTSNGAPGAVDGAFTIVGSGNDVVLHYSAAPEPAGVTLLGLGMLSWIGRRPGRRR